MKQEQLIVEGQSYKYIWGDDFNDPALPLWNRHTLRDDDLHRAGNRYLDDEGNVTRHEWPGAAGHRWAGRYDKHMQRTARVENGALVFQPVVTRERNPVRESFTHDGVHYPTGEYQIALPWLCSIAPRIWSNEHKRHITDFSKPYFVLTRGSVVQYGIDFSRMKARDIRHSIWPMPLCDEEEENTPDNPATIDEMTKAYDGNIKDAEDDFHEYVWSERRHFGLLSCKLVAGDAKDTKGHLHERSVDAVDFDQVLPGDTKTLGEILRSQPVTFRMIWYPDGSRSWQIRTTTDAFNEIQYDPRKMRTKSYLIMSMEANMGIEDGHPDKIPSNGPKRPEDYGLDGQPWILDRDIAGDCVTVLHYLHVYKHTGPVDRVQAVSDQAGHCECCGQQLPPATDPTAPPVQRVPTQSVRRDQRNGGRRRSRRLG